MHTLAPLSAMLAVLAIGVVSPGPSFLFVARTAVANSRGAAVAAAFGMALGATGRCVAALLGLSAPRPRGFYLRAKPVLQRCVGAVLATLELRLIRASR
ncbi:threonine efflux system [mine drainage metagenome]|jgi:threonine/homoserine/homoserine lactone efflux protein|uniref:Threonine efflux system n=1 Tax=mine drainage metagenome TaxID=410659 RepID=A0A1J5Q223_9ZZZZ